MRIDSHLFPGYTISPHYDSMVAKLIVHGADREEALARMRRALGECLVDGIDTTIPFHREVLADPDFRAGRYDTGFLERYLVEKEEAAAKAKESACRLTAGMRAAVRRPRCRTERCRVFSARTA